MKQFFTLLLLITAITTYAQTTYTVDNKPGAPADFDNLQEAIDAAADGDILLVQGSENSYGGITINKQLVIKGTGYFLSENDSTQAYPNDSKINGVNFALGSSGTTFTGFNTAYPYDGIFNVNDSNIVISYNRIKYINLNESSNIYLFANYIYSSYSNSPYSYTPYSIAGGNGNILIVGNYVTNNVLTSCVLRNNFVGGGIISASSAQNNITFGTSLSGNPNYQNNMRIYNPPLDIIDSDDYGNSWGYGFLDLFIDDTNPLYSTDGQYIIKPGSPAIGAGVGGVDCGMFGGGYRLSGIPNIPNIYEFDVPNTGYTNEGGIQVTVKVKSNN